MRLTVGGRWLSAVSAAEVIVVKAANAGVDLRCGGVPMVAARDGEVSGNAPGELLVGKRYAAQGGDTVLLCVKGGGGKLSIDGVELSPMATKSLPASD
jgi:hypothetical protein